jgi:hypothetical protein
MVSPSWRPIDEHSLSRASRAMLTFGRQMSAESPDQINALGSVQID